MYKPLAVCTLFCALTLLSSTGFATADESATAAEPIPVKQDNYDQQTALEQQLYTAQQEKNIEDQIEIFYELGETNVKKKNYDKASAYFQMALQAIADIPDGSLDPDEEEQCIGAISILNELVADCLYHTGKIEAANTLYRKTLADRKDIQSKAVVGSPAEKGDEYIGMAMHYFDMLSFYFSEKLAGQYTMDEMPSVEQPLIALEYLKMALSLKAGVIEDAEEIEPLYLALADLYTLADPGDIDRIISFYIQGGKWDNAGMAATDAGYYEMAPLLFYRDRKSAALLSGTEIDSIGQFMQTLELAETFLESGPYGWAYKLNNRAFDYANFEPSADAKFVNYLTFGQAAVSMAGLYEKFGNNSKAVKLYRQGMEALLTAIDKATYSVDTILAEDLSLAYLGLAQNASQRGNYGEADQLHAKALAVAENSGDLKPYLLWRVHEGIGVSKRQQGLVDQAITLHQDNIAAMLQLFHGSHPHIVGAYHNLGLALTEKGELGLALDAYIEAMTMVSHFSIATSPSAIRLNVDLGRLYGKLGNPLAAVLFIDRALDISEGITSQEFKDKRKEFKEEFEEFFKKLQEKIDNEVDELLADEKVSADYQTLVCEPYTAAVDKASSRIAECRQVGQVLSDLIKLGWRNRQLRGLGWQGKHSLLLDGWKEQATRLEKEKQQELRLLLRSLGQQE